MEIELSNRPGMFFSVSDQDYERVNRYKWFLKKTRGGIDYPARSVRVGKKVKTIWLHRFIMNCPDNMVVDHKDGNRLNNERYNLEIVTRSENSKRIHWKERKELNSQIDHLKSIGAELNEPIEKTNL